MKQTGWYTFCGPTFLYLKIHSSTNIWVSPQVWFGFKLDPIQTIRKNDSCQDIVAHGCPTYSNKLFTTKVGTHSVHLQKTQAQICNMIWKWRCFHLKFMKRQTWCFGHLIKFYWSFVLGCLVEKALILYLQSDHRTEEARCKKNCTNKANHCNAKQVRSKTCRLFASVQKSANPHFFKLLFL